MLFVQTLHETTDTPVTLWQIPVGHINGSLAANPYDASGNFLDLDNTPTKYEDSAGTFFLGDRFVVNDPERLAYFSQNQWQDAGVSVEGNVVTWAPNIDDVRAAGVNTLLFGAGVGISTDGVGEPPTDGYWWISNVQKYYESLDDGTLTQMPLLSVNNPTILEGDEGTTILGFNVTLSTPSEQPVTVEYSTQDGTAIATADYLAASGMLTFAPGETRKTVAVQVKGDTVAENNESFGLKLSNPNGATISVIQGIGTITNDDQAVINPSNDELLVSFTVNSQWYGGFGGTITLTNQSSQAIDGWTVGFDSEFAITALWNGDYRSKGSGSYEVSNLSWNSMIAPSSSVSFGFNGNWAGEVIPEPTNYLFNLG